MNRLAILLAALFAPSAFAQSATSTACGAPSAGAMDESLAHDVVWTSLAGYDDHSTRSTGSIKTEVSITLKHLVRPCWSTFSWEVELLLPHNVQPHGNAIMKSTGNTRTHVVTFEVEMPIITSGDARPANAHNRFEKHDYRGTLRVKFMPNAANPSVSHGAPVERGGVVSRSEFWRYPVVFTAG